LASPLTVRHAGAPRRRRSSILCGACALAASLVVPPLAAQGYSPSAAFLQAGTAAQTHEVTTGLIWDWEPRWSVGAGVLTGYWELSVSGWSYPTPDGRKSAGLGQIGAVPTFRYGSDAASQPWFLELGVGLTATTTLYETRAKRFSTSFNFADHVAAGVALGKTRQHEVALRLQHFSNAGIKHPNPGENFWEIRYVHRFH
jgi:lipid A 3-O-deacylase